MVLFGLRKQYTHLHLVCFVSDFIVLFMAGNYVGNGSSFIDILYLCGIEWSSAEWQRINSKKMKRKKKNETKRVYYLTDEREKKGDWKAKAKQNS